jgi:hypothetical protein
VPPGPEVRYGVHFLSSGPGVTPLLSPLAPTLGRSHFPFRVRHHPTKLTMLKLALSLLVITSFLGCVSKPVSTGPKPVIRTVALIPATLPQQYSIQSTTAIQFLIPIAAAAAAIDSKAKAKTFADKLRSPDFQIDQELTGAVVESLKAKGYEVTLLQNIQRSADSPDYFDYPKLSHSADATVHVYFSDVGLESPRGKTEFFQRVNVTGMVYVPQNKTYPYESSIFYGIDAKEGKEWAILADPKHVYPSFDFVLSNLDTVRANFKVGVKLVAERLADQIHGAIR